MTSPAKDPYTKEVMLTSHDQALVEHMLTLLPALPNYTSLDKEPEGMLAHYKMVEEVKGSISKQQLAALYQSLEVAWDNRTSEQETIILENMHWPINKMGRFGIRKVFKLHKSLTNNIKALELAAPEPERMLTSGQMASKVQKAPENMKPLYNQLEQLWKNKANTENTIHFKGIEWPTNKMGIFKPRNTFKLHESLEDNVRQGLNMGAKEPEGMLPGYQMADNLEANEEKIQKLYKALQLEWENQPQAETITVEGVEWPTNKMGVFGSKKTFKLHKDLEINIANIFDITPLMPEPNGMLSSMQMAIKIHVAQKTTRLLYNELEQLWKNKANTENTIYFKGVEWPTDKMGKYGPARKFKLHESLKEHIKTALNVAALNTSEEMLTFAEMARKLQTKDETIQTFYTTLQSEWENQPPSQKTMKVKEVEWPIDKMGIFRKGSRIAFRVHQDLDVSIIRALNLAPPAPKEPKGMLGFNKMSRKIEAQDKKVQKLYGTLQKIWEENEDKQDFVTVGNIKWPMKQMGKYGPARTFKLHINLQKYVRQALNIPPPAPKEPEGMLTNHQMARKVNSSDKITKPLYERLEVAWKNKTEGQKIIELEDIQWPTDKMGIYGPLRAFKLHESLKEYVKKALKIPPKEPEGMLSVTQAYSKVSHKKGTKTLYETLKTEWESKGQKQKTIDVNGIEWPTDKMGIFGPQKTFKLHKDLFSLVKTAIGKTPSPTNALLQKKLTNEIAPGALKNIEKKDLSPETIRLEKNTAFPAKRSIALFTEHPLDSVAFYQ